ncbi:MAG: glycosyltransferase family 9 protein [Spirochaetes bacterium]|nr:glycosyltransferase family 9 protein [Spirochaetota bacterium]
MKIFKKIERIGKKYLFHIIRRIFPSPPLTKKSSSGIRNVLVVRIDERLGNLVLLTPVIRSFLKNHINITALVAGKFSKLLKAFDHVRIIEFEKKRLFNPFYLIRFVIMLRRLKMDLLFDASNPNNLSLLTFFTIMLTKARIKLGFSRKNSDLILNHQISGPKKDVPMVRYYQILFQEMNLKYDPDPRINLLPSVRNKYKKLKKMKMIACHPGGRGPKQWPVLNMFHLLDRIKKYYRTYDFLIIAGPQEQHLTEIFQKKNFKVVTPKDVMDLASYFSICEIFLGNDSGPMHLAASLGLKIVAIFNDTARVVFQPQSRHYKIISSSRPDKISVDSVWKAFQYIEKKR